MRAAGEDLRGVGRISAAVPGEQRAQEQNKLHAGGNKRGHYAVPVCGHGGDPREVREVKEVNEVKEVKDPPTPFQRWTRKSFAFRILYLLNFLNLIYFRRAAAEKTFDCLCD